MLERQMTKAQKIEISDRIAAKHGCVIEPGANGMTVLSVLPQHNEGTPTNYGRLAACRKDIEAAGVSTEGWQS